MLNQFETIILQPTIQLTYLIIPIILIRYISTCFRIEDLIVMFTLDFLVDVQ